MKLRISGNSVRLRLKPSEVAELRESGRVEDRAEFGGGAALVYGLRSEGAEAPAVTFRDGRLEVTLPRETAMAWASSDEVSIAGQQGSLAILVEKDFQCMHRDAADTDVYPNPLH